MSKSEEQISTPDTDYLPKLNELRRLFPWVQKKEISKLSSIIALNHCRETIMGVGVYRNDESDLMQFKRALGCWIYFLKEDGYSFHCTFKSSAVKFPYGCKSHNGAELVELELLPANNMKDADKKFELIDSSLLPGIDAIWACAFDTKICVEFGKSLPLLIIPGLQVGGRYVAVVCVDKTINLTTISRLNVGTKVCYPKSIL